MRAEGEGGTKEGKKDGRNGFEDGEKKGGETEEDSEISVLVTRGNF